jgi:hypothetical protein
MIADTIRRHPDVEIVLQTFVDLTGRWPTPDPFDAFVAEVREHYDQLDAPTFFMVGFHPAFGEPDRLNPQTFVQLLRRTPDPVIQCVRAEVLERVRAQAQATARARQLAQIVDPELRALFERSIMADSELSSDIAEHNFASVGIGEGRARLERALEQVQAARRELVPDGSRDAPP